MIYAIALCLYVLCYLVIQVMFLFYGCHVSQHKRKVFVILVVYTILFKGMDFLLNSPDPSALSTTTYWTYWSVHTLDTFIIIALMAVYADGTLGRNWVKLFFYYDLVTTGANMLVQNKLILFLTDHHLSASLFSASHPKDLLWILAWAYTAAAIALSIEKEEYCLEECSQLLRYIHGGSTAQEALIADKKGKCEQLGIRFEDEIRALPDPAVMQEIDMISLMGNLLDNAIEACQASGQEKPYLRFSSMIRKKVWMIEVSNSKSSGLSPKKEGMKTTKEDTLNHGLGIGIISSIVSSYNGSLFMEDHGDYFETSAQLFLKKSSRRNRRKKKSVYE